MSSSHEILNRDILIHFIINLAMFIIVWRVLASSLFSVFSDTFEKRRELVDGQRYKARELHLKAEEIARDYELRISKEKAEIKKTIEKVIEETEIAQRKYIQSANEIAASELNETRKRISEEAEKVRERLKDDVPSIAVKMASRVIGRDLVE